MTVMATAPKKTLTPLERLLPVFLLASIALSFVLGVLWQRVSDLENGGVRANAGGTTGTTNTQPATASVLDNLPAMAKAAGVDTGKFQTCLDKKEFESIVNADYNTGLAAGVQGTPGNFIVNAKGDVWYIPGALPYASMKPVIEAALGNGTVDASSGIEKLSADKAAKLAKVSDKDHVKGASNPQVYLIEYSDFECPYCKQFYGTAVQAMNEYKDKLAWVYRHFPLDQIHPLARPAANASECIFNLGGAEAFWKFTDKAFTS